MPSNKLICILLPALLLAGPGLVKAQCPLNIGFEQGSLANWQFDTGHINSSGVITLDPAAAPVADRHTLLKSSTTAFDPFGHFPLIASNNSKYLVRLGNSSTQAQAERMSYTFTIPTNQNVYSFIYRYAVVLQNPNHTPPQQPGFTSKLFDVDSNTYIECGTFQFVAAANLPGFILSDVFASPLDVQHDVYYKTWTPITINLSGRAGRTIRLEFTTNDCSEGGHFGYAYFDVDENCNASPIIGNTICSSNDYLVLTGPYGFAGYNWYESDLTTLVGTGNSISLQPAPSPGSVFALEIVPYPGQGCRDTIYTTIALSGTPFSMKTTDSITACLPAVVDISAPGITAGSSPGLTFTYYSDSTASAALPSPAISQGGTYYIKAADTTGCTALRPITVILNDTPLVRISSPPPIAFPATANITSPLLANGDLTGLSLTYWQDTAATQPLDHPEAIAQSGTYYVKEVNDFGCSVVMPLAVVITPPVISPPNAFTPNGDGINDTWTIASIDHYPQCIVTVFDRTGQTVFKSYQYNTPWDGRLNGKPLPFGTYYYIIRLNDKQTVSGSVTLIR